MRYIGFIILWVILYSLLHKEDHDRMTIYGSVNSYPAPPPEPIQQRVYPYKLYSKDTTPYRGNYVDIQPN